MYTYKMAHTACGTIFIKMLLSVYTVSLKEHCVNNPHYPVPAAVICSKMELQYYSGSNWPQTI